MKNFMLSFCLFLLPVMLLAEWSKDPLNNYQISFLTDSTLTAKTIADNDGNYYVMYYNIVNTENHFHLYLQKLDKDGNKLWGDRGKQITNTPFGKWISDFDLQLDEDGSILLAFEDQRESLFDRTVNIYKISPNGENLWGENGVQMPGKEGEAYLSPQIIKTSDGRYVVVYTTLTNKKNAGSIELVSLNGKGEILVHRQVKHQYSDPKIFDVWPKIFPTKNGNIYFTWNAVKGSDIDTLIGGWGDRKLYIQKMDSELKEIWNENVIFAQSHTFFGFRIDHTVDFALDENQDLYVTWFDNTDFNATVKLNHVDSLGNLKFGEFGIAIDKNNDNASHLFPIIHYDVNEKAAFIYWIEELIKVSHRGSKYPEYRIYSNKMLDEKNTWEWGDIGKVILENECGLDPYLIHASNMNDGFQTLFFSDRNLTVEACRMTADGEVTGFVLLSDNPYSQDSPITLKEKIDFFVTDFKNNQWVVTWVDILNFIQDSENSLTLFLLKGQNVSADGKLGPVHTGIIDINIDTKDILVYPNPSNTQLNIKFKENIDSNPILNIYTSNGKLVQTISNAIVDDNIIIIDISKLDKGVYFINVKIGNTFNTLKFVK